MAVDRKTGKPVATATPLDVGRAFAEDLVRAGVIDAADVGAVAADLVRCMAADRAVPPPGLSPRGVSLLRGAYGPWLAAGEWAKSEAKRQP
jgi:hypothetical protein